MVTKPIANNSKIVIDCPILILIYWFPFRPFGLVRRSTHSATEGVSLKTLPLLLPCQVLCNILMHLTFQNVSPEIFCKTQDLTRFH
jgi:hypothetical protein